MEQIIIHHADGSETPLFSRKNVSGISKATQKTALLSDDAVTIGVSSAVPLPVGIGDRIEVYGRTYKANQLPQPTKNGQRRFEYDITFEGLQYDLIDAQYKLPPDAYGDTYYSDLRGHLTVLVWNANRVQPNKWHLGDCPATGATAYKNINTASRNCLQVLQDICSEWGVEFEITPGDGFNTINIKEKAGITHPFTLRYGRGKGLYSLKRTNVNNAGITTRLFVYGSQDNLGRNYGHTRLCLPDTDRLTSYLEDATAKAKYGTKENEKIYDIKPERVGKVTALGPDEITFSDTTQGDNAMFDLNAKGSDGSTLYLLGDVAAKVKFQTGQLAGYEFDIHSYDHATRTFVLKRFTDENGMVFPSATAGAFQISVNDEYIITEIQLPQSYIIAAQNKLLEAANKDFPAMTQPQVSYKLTIAEDFFTAMFGREVETEILHVGDYINVEDEDIGVSKAVRIVRIERNLLKRHSYDITLSDTVTKSTTVRVLNEIEDINEVITINKLADPAKARRRWLATQELLNMVFDPEGDYYSEKIKPLSIETQMLSVGAKSTQFTLQNITFQPNYNKNPNTLYVSNGRLIHYAIEETIRTWVLSSATYSGLNPSAAYFIYAKCSTTGGGGQIILSTQAIKVEQEAGYYNFLIGVLNSVVTDAGGKNPGRLVSLTYGSTTINGRFLRTGRIESSGGGKCYFDLDNDEIGGVIRFVGTDGKYHDLTDVQEKTDELKDYINNTLPGILGDLQGQLDGVIEQWFYEVDPSPLNTAPLAEANEPAKEWAEADTAAGNNNEKEKHLGDLYYNTTSGKVWRYVKGLVSPRPGAARGLRYYWQELEDTELAQALALAQDALDAANDKAKIFVSTPYTPYHVGDLWVQGSTGDILRCKTERLTGAFNSGDWEKASKYTDNSALTNFINNNFLPTVNDIEGQIDGKIESWFQTTDPSTAWTTTAERRKHVGDMWYNGSTHTLKRYSETTYSYTNGQTGLTETGYGHYWTTIQDQKAIDAYEAANNAQDTADRKRQVFVSTPYGPYDIGDLWLRSWTDSTGVARKDLYRAIAARASGYNANDWAEATFYDNTQVTIDKGIITAGTVQLANGNSQSIVAGITGGENEAANETEARKVRIWAGASKTNRFTAPFRVLQDGTIYATKAFIEGVITAIAGKIANWEIDGNYIQSILSSEEIAQGKTPAIRLNSDPGEILCGDSVVLDDTGLNMFSGGYTKLKIYNGSVGDYSDYILKSAANIAERKSLNTRVYIPGGGIQNPMSVAALKMSCLLGFMDKGSHICVDNFGFSLTAPSGMKSNTGKPNITVNPPCAFLRIKRDGIVVKTYSLTQSGTLMAGTYRNFQANGGTFYISAGDEGIYSLEFETNNLKCWCEKTGETEDFTISGYINGSFLRGNYERTILGNDGLLAGWKNGAMLMSNDLFIVQFGNFGIKVNTSGFQVKTRNKQYWHDLND